MGIDRKELESPVNSSMLPSISFEHNISLDMLRVMAAFAVVGVHSNRVVLDADPSTLNWWVANIYAVLTRWCVPIFIMISGALILSCRPQSNPFLFYQRRFSRIGLITIFWTLFYLARAARHDYSDVVPLLIKMVVQGYTHLWYLYMLVCLYLAVPFLGQFVESSSRSLLKWSIFLSFGTAAGHSLLTRSLLQRSGFSPFEWPLYVGYFLVGYYFVTYKPNVSRRLATIFFCFFALIVVIVNGYFAQHLGPSHACAIMFFYLNPLVIAMSLSFFLAIYESDTAKIKKAYLYMMFAKLAPYTLGIYVIHPLIKSLIGRIGLQSSAMEPVLGIPVLTIAAIVGSLFSVIIISKLPFLRRIVV
jgi:surface polysaccharide O-acyltransferase-like enzyme